MWRQSVFEANLRRESVFHLMRLLALTLLTEAQDGLMPAVLNSTLCGYFSFGRLLIRATALLGSHASRGAGIQGAVDDSTYLNTSKKKIKNRHRKHCWRFKVDGLIDPDLWISQ